VKRTSWVSEVTLDAVKHFAWGIGDNNPLWVDADYGPKSALNRTIAPPSFAYAIDETSVAPGYEGYERHYQTVNWEWFHPFEIGDRITAETKLLEADEDSSEGSIRQHGEIIFVSESNGVIAKASVIVRRDKNPLPEIDQRQEIRYNSDELFQIEDKVLSEDYRGAKPRFWEEIVIGESIGTITKGPLSIMDIVAWCAGTQGAPDDQHECSSGGLDTQAATGPQLTAWIIHLITNWMGDNGFLSQLMVNFDELPFLGSTTTITGTITQTSNDDSGHWCEVSISCQLQNNHLAATATALISLPLKENSNTAT